MGGNSHRCGSISPSPISYELKGGLRCHTIGFETENCVKKQTKYMDQVPSPSEISQYVGALIEKYLHMIPKITKL